MLAARNPSKREQRRRDEHDAEKQRRKDGLRAALVATQGRAASMGPAQLTPAAKDVPARNPALLEMAQGRPCLLIAVPDCHGMREDTSTTVACHQNQGKGTSQRRPDQYSVWGCRACHTWYDQSGAPRETKRARFLTAHIRQVDHWRYIATSKAEPERARRAAQWALDRLNATPVFDLEAAP
ncbi:DUF1364 family protein [Pseudorhodoferax sp. Leaf265]|uniref:DUF1364 family protein n=1 Tax=Pseudorhodoferax sp. Leaf265 TaxID=1736315 RepID=UPI0006F8A07F|nr:DUF1364 family protein [Pseudorhodoferax sp. Leaf265]KQP02474.1 hypothetical protein ASF45_20690 [Pseudorhodoferax sp. Leaf265]